MGARRWFAAALSVAVLGTAAFVAGGIAGAEEDAGGMPVPQKKIDHPFAKGMVGAWDWTSTSDFIGPGKGTITYKLACLDTVVIEDLDGSFSEGPMAGPFQGHGMWKIGADGTTLTTWWLDNMTDKAEEYTGTLAADGYDIKKADGHRMVVKKTATGFEMKMYMGDQVAMTITGTKRK